MSSRQIWVDADACPKVVKEILFRAADRVCVPLILVANQILQVPGSRYIRSIQVAAGFDVADNHIVQQANSGDLVITADIPLAAEVVAKGCLARNSDDVSKGAFGKPPCLGIDLVSIDNKTKRKYGISIECIAEV